MAEPRPPHSGRVLTASLSLFLSLSLSLSLSFPLSHTHAASRGSGSQSALALRSGRSAMRGLLVLVPLLLGTAAATGSTANATTTTLNSSSAPDTTSPQPVSSSTANATATTLNSNTDCTANGTVTDLNSSVTPSTATSQNVWNCTANATATTLNSSVTPSSTTSQTSSSSTANATATTLNSSSTANATTPQPVSNSVWYFTAAGVGVLFIFICLVTLRAMCCRKREATAADSKETEYALAQAPKPGPWIQQMSLLTSRGSCPGDTAHPVRSAGGSRWRPRVLGATRPPRGLWWVARSPITAGQPSGGLVSRKDPPFASQFVWTWSDQVLAKLMDLQHFPQVHYIIIIINFLLYSAFKGGFSKRLTGRPQH
ncbi:serine-rich adhesin for platelets-like isoform X7 [Lepisosteus oculatus]|uniref:serine-rich adhesin for platelets-like isoform X7 n=1 Tax=Lepisosteus oculatus TaxID=7918 RepID=UPI0035F52B46